MQLVEQHTHPLLDLTYRRLQEEKKQKLAQLRRYQEEREQQLARSLEAANRANWDNWSVRVDQISFSVTPMSTAETEPSFELLLPPGSQGPTAYGSLPQEPQLVEVPARRGEDLPILPRPPALCQPSRPAADGLVSRSSAGSDFRAALARSRRSLRRAASRESCTCARHLEARTGRDRGGSRPLLRHRRSAGSASAPTTTVTASRPYPLLRHVRQPPSSLLLRCRRSGSCVRRRSRPSSWTPILRSRSRRSLRRPLLRHANASQPSRTCSEHRRRRHRNSGSSKCPISVSDRLERPTAVDGDVDAEIELLALSRRQRTSAGTCTAPALSNAATACQV